MGSPVSQLLRSSKLFSLLDENGQERLEKVAREVIYQAGTVILREGEPGDAFFLTIDGAVRIEADTFSGPKHLATLGAGAIFGEIAALTREPRTATVTTETDTRVLRFEAQEVLLILRDYPKVLEILNRIGLRRSEETLEAMLDDTGDLQMITG